MLAAFKKRIETQKYYSKINKSVGISKSNQYRQRMNGQRDPKEESGPF